MILGSGMAALLTGLVLLGLLTGRTWVGRKFPLQPGDEWADRPITPLKFWWGIIFHVLLAAFLWSGVLYQGNCLAVAGLARLVVQQPVHPFLGETLRSAPHCRPAHTGPVCHLQDQQLIRRERHNVLLRAVAIADNRSQARAVFFANKNAYGLFDALRITWFGPLVNPRFAAMH